MKNFLSLWHIIKDYLGYNTLCILINFFQILKHISNIFQSFISFLRIMWTEHPKACVMALIGCSMTHAFSLMRNTFSNIDNNLIIWNYNSNKKCRIFKLNKKYQKNIWSIYDYLIILRTSDTDTLNIPLLKVSHVIIPYCLSIVIKLFRDSKEFHSIKT